MLAEPGVVRLVGVHAGLVRIPVGHHRIEVLGEIADQLGALGCTCCLVIGHRAILQRRRVDPPEQWIDS
jgi:hypothetical protein